MGAREEALREMTPRQLYESQIEVIERVIEWIRRRHAMRPDEAEDFASWVHLRLLDNDCAVLAKFQGKCKLATYLTTVINNLYKDYLISKSSKWRPSARAKALGWQAVALETEISRNGHSVRDAIRFVRQELGVTLSEEELERLASELPVRHRRTFVDTSKLTELSSTADTGQTAMRREASSTAESVTRAVAQALADLPPQDSLILRMRFHEGHKVVTIAEVLGLQPRGLYSRIARLLKTVRATLAEMGVTWPDVQEALGAELVFELGPGETAPDESGGSKGRESS